ncbi:DUF3021 domain-containing protein [Fructilactobacillus sp. Tb1]|uniref:DUF3021 domain-containing protein n=1 Tax=Fructilactobacillus sp. Tb1 TaxID=3422304 RepID=UPI003D2CA90B
MKIFKQHFILGVVNGIFIGFTLALLISFSYHLSYFQPSNDQFIHYWGNNLNATAASTILWALIGLVFSFASLIFGIESWGITKQTIVHFIITYLLFTPLAILAGWFPLQFSFLVSFTIIFISIYICIWCYSFKKAKENLKLINSQIKANKKRI